MMPSDEIDSVCVELSTIYRRRSRLVFRSETALSDQREDRLKIVTKRSETNHVIPPTSLLNVIRRVRRTLWAHYDFFLRIFDGKIQFQLISGNVPTYDSKNRRQPSRSPCTCPGQTEPVIAPATHSRVCGEKVFSFLFLNGYLLEEVLEEKIGRNVLLRFFSCANLA